MLAACPDFSDVQAFQIDALQAERLGGHDLLQGLTMFFFGFIAGNIGAMAMEPMGHIAGTASSAPATRFP